MPLYGMSFIGRLIILFIGTDDQHILSYNPNIVSNANIEIHSDKMKNGTLKNIRVLASAFWNGKDIVPVEIGMNI